MSVSYNGFRASSAASLTNLSIDHLNGDLVRTVAQQTVFIDAGGDAVVQADGPIMNLSVDFGLSAAATDHVGIDTTGPHITLSGAIAEGVEILYDGTKIGTISGFHLYGMDIDFVTGVTSAQVGDLIHTLTYTNSSDPAAILARDIGINLNVGLDDGVFTSSTILVAPVGVKFNAVGVDSLIGSGADDLFAITENRLDIGDTLDGGGGNDTLQLVGDGGYFDLTHFAMFKQIEVIKGGSGQDAIIINAEQLADIQSIDGGTGSQSNEIDALYLDGTSIDLTGKAIVNMEYISLQTDNAVVTLNDKALALHMNGYGQNTKLILNGGTFTAQERRMLHDHGITTIKDAEKTDVDAPPQVSGLNGDHVRTVPQRTVFLDAGRNALITDDGTGIRSLTVDISKGSNATDQLGIDTSGRVSLLGGYVTTSPIFIGGEPIGYIYEAGSSHLDVQFYNPVNLAMAQEFIRAITYTNKGNEAIASREITIRVDDTAGNVTQSVVTIDQDEKPTQVNLSQASVSELAVNGTLIGLLSAQDLNVEDTFTYSLLDNAGSRFKLDATGTKLVVADGLKLDFEQDKSHVVTVRVTDKGGLFLDKAFTIKVQDVSPETIVGSALADKFVGGDGRDTLKGEAGNDILAGGFGNDILTGGLGRDTFVFDTRPSKAKNFDTIRDFNVKDDTIQLAKAVFTKIGKVGTLKKDAFFTGDKAHDGDDRIIFSKKNGKVYYDQDGTGTKAMVEIMKLDKASKLALSHRDFIIA
jgi:serralysin